MAYVLDTNIFNWLVDGDITADALPADDSYVTHIQVDEINRISDDERRARVSLMLAAHTRGVLPTESFVVGISRLDFCKLSDGELYSSLKAALDTRSNGGRANMHDALIAEVAISNRYVLLTADRALADVTRAHGGQAVLFERPSP